MGNAMPINLTTEEKAVIGLLFDCIGGGAADGDARFEGVSDPGACASIIYHNGIMLTVYPALSKSGCGAAKAVCSMLQQRYYRGVFQAVAQDKEGKLLLDALENAGMDAIPLKGWLLRRLYPEFSMRSMSDLDVLLRDYDWERLLELMTGLGYASGGHSTWKHDEFRKREIGITAEMHKRLTDDSGRIQKWEKTLWSRASAEEGYKHIFRMCDEDFYIFHILHMHKDMTNGHIGLRRLADTRLYLRAHPDMDRAYIEKQFAEMGVLEFARRIERVTAVCAGEAEADEASLMLLHHACTDGIFGTGASYKLSRAARSTDGSFKKGKFLSVLSAVFLPYSRMKAHFPILQKLPFLLPFCWIVRLFRSRKGVKGKLKKLDYSDLSEEDFRYMQDLLKAAGIK